MGSCGSFEFFGSLGSGCLEGPGGLKVEVGQRGPVVIGALGGLRALRDI